jgi:hypothetical protein
MVIITRQTSGTLRCKESTLHISALSVGCNIRSMRVLAYSSLKSRLIFCMGCNDAPSIREDIFQMFLLMDKQVSRTTSHENFDPTNTIHTFYALQIIHIVLSRADKETMMSYGFLGSQLNFCFEGCPISGIGYVVWHI